MVGSQLLEPTETFPVLVTARIVIITFVVGKPSKLAFATPTGKGDIGIHITKGLPTIPLSFSHRRTDQDICLVCVRLYNLIFVDSCAQLQPTFNNKYMIQPKHFEVAMVFDLHISIISSPYSDEPLTGI